MGPDASTFMLLAVSTLALGTAVVLVNHLRSARTRLDVAYAEVARLATHDRLTGLPNRSGTTELLHDLLRESPVALLSIEVRGSTPARGPRSLSAPDAVALATPSRIVELMPAGSRLARPDDQSFLLLHPLPVPQGAGAAVTDADTTTGEGSVTSLRLLAEHLLEHCCRPVEADGQLIAVVGRVGVAVADTHTSARTALGDAEMTRSVASFHGASRISLLDETIRRDARVRAELTSDIRRAAGAGVLGEFEIYYQPIVSLRTGRITGAESLLRWNHPRYGILGPDQWLTVAEDVGAIRELGRRVRSEVAGRFGALNASRPGTELSVSVNVSETELADPALAEELGWLVEATSLEPEQLVLDVSERVIDPSVIARLADLRSVGVRLSIDDFGTGATSLSRLSTIAASQLKVDPVLIGGLGTDRTVEAVVRTIVELGRAHGMECVAEGVTTLEQADLLRDLGCDLAQGFLFGRPAPFSRFVAMLSQADREPLVSEQPIGAPPG